MTDVETHGDWLIWHAPLPIEWRGADWHYARKDALDATDIGHEESRQMCLQSIDYIESEEARAETPEGKAEEAKFVDNAMRLLNRALLARALEQILQIPGIGNLPGFATGTHLSSARYALQQYKDQTGTTPNPTPVLSLSDSEVRS